MFPQPLQSVKMGDGAAWGWKFSSDLQVSFASPSGEILAWLLTKRGCNYIVYHCWNISMSQRWCHDPDNTLFYVSPTDNCDKSHDRVVKVNDGSINSIENNNGSYCTQVISIFKTISMVKMFLHTQVLQIYFNLLFLPPFRRNESRICRTIPRWCQQRRMPSNCRALVGLSAGSFGFPLLLIASRIPEIHRRTRDRALLRNIEIFLSAKK